MTAGNTSGYGSKARCMVEEYLLGQMEEPMTADTSTTKNKESENTRGQMGNTMKVSGSTDSNMAKEHLQTSKA